MRLHAKIIASAAAGIAGTGVAFVTMTAPTTVAAAGPPDPSPAQQIIDRESAVVSDLVANVVGDGGQGPVAVGQQVVGQLTDWLGLGGLGLPLP